MAIIREFSKSVERSEELTQDLQMQYEPGTYEAPLVFADEAEQFFKRNEGVNINVAAGTIVDQNIFFTVEFQVNNPSEIAKVQNAIRNCAISHGEIAFKSNEKLAKAIRQMCGVKCVVSIKQLLTSYHSSTTVQGLKGEATVGLTTETKVHVDEFAPSFEQ